MNNPLQLLSQSPAKQNNTTKTKMTTHRVRKETVNGFIPSCLSPRFPWPLVLLTCSPQALPTVACGSILICTSTPASYSPVFSRRGVGDTPSRACVARPDPCRDRAALGGLGVRRGGPAGWGPLRPPGRARPRPVRTQGFPLCGGVAWPRGSATSPRIAVGVRGANATLCVFVCIPFALPASPSWAGFPPARPCPPSRSTAPCVWQKRPEGPPLLRPSGRSLHGVGTSLSSDTSLSSPNSVFLPLLL